MHDTGAVDVPNSRCSLFGVRDELQQRWPPADTLRRVVITVAIDHGTATILRRRAARAAVRHAVVDAQTIQKGAACAGCTTSCGCILTHTNE